jgi:hypothetical protein
MDLWNGTSMKVFDDLDAMTWGTTLAAVMLSAPVAVNEIRNWKKPSDAKSGFVLVLLLAGTLWCGILGFSTLDNASDARHSSVTGKLQVAGYGYAGRGSHIVRYVACVADCNSASVPLIMEPRAQSIVKARKDLPALQIGYLVESGRNPADTGGFKVVDISDPSTGASLYHLDTSHHPVRASAFFADAALFLLAGLLGLRPVKHEPVGNLPK